jgi:hypothetical protein
MIENWPTQAIDLKDAEIIISKYIDFNDGEALGMFEIVLTKGDAVDFRIADWVIELSDFFNGKYGPEEGAHITKMVLSKCLINGDNIH